MTKETNKDRLADAKARMAAKLAERGITPASPSPTATSVPALAGGFGGLSDGFDIDDDDDEGGRGGIIGKRLKFRKGEYIVGREEASLAIGTKLRAKAMSKAWCEFRGHELVNVVNQVPEQPFPKREDLGDTDPAGWPVGDDGRPADPFVLSRYLLLVDPATGLEYTFVTSSFGGAQALRQLRRQIENYRIDHPGALPIVSLEAGRFMSKRFGPVPVPEFRVLAWTDADGRPLRERPLGDPLNDEIPF